MATKNRNRSRRPASRERGPRYVAPVLDPNWHSPYAPSAHERHANERAALKYAIRKRTPQTIAVGVVVVGLLAGIAVSPYSAIFAVAVAALYLFDLRKVEQKIEQRAGTLGSVLLGEFKAGGTTKDRLRLVTVLERLTATFGVDNVSAFIVDDSGYNACLVPNGENYSLFITASMMGNFELIEVEAVIAHLLARVRLGLNLRQGLSAVESLAPSERAALAGIGSTYRADEVAAAAIRYPLGLAAALERCARHRNVKGSFISSPLYDQTRWVFFDVYADRGEPDFSDTDDVALRALALKEW